jgi:exopolysaccharide production protein ExoZ
VIRPIQYLRALAAMMIVWVHSLYIIPGTVERLGVPNFGGNGVDLFFVISGFIMVVTTVGKKVTPQRFFLRRIIRVVPLYWLATLAVIACAAAKHSFNEPYPPAAIVKSLLFIPYSSLEVPRGVWPILQNGWTLNYEMFFYSLFALSLAAPRRVRLPSLAVTLGSLVVIGRVFGPFGSPLALFYTSAFLLEFVAGMILAHGWLRHGSRDSLLQSALLIVFGLYCMGSTHSRLIVMSGAFILVAGCLNPRICAIRNRPLLELGNASYSIYLTHEFVLEALAWSWIRLIPLATWASAALFLVLAPVLCALAGCLCYRCIERPLTSQLRRLVESSGPGPVVNGGARELTTLPHSDP